MRTVRILLSALAGAIVAGGGCAKYESKPLNAAAVERTLATPDDRALRVAAAELRHPLLKPVELDPARPMSPDQLAVLAVIVHPDLRAERDRRAAAGAQVIQAGILPNPVLNASVDLPYHSTPPDSFTAYTIGPSWEVTSLIARDAKVRAARAGAASVDLDIAWKEWQTALAAKLAAYGVLATEEQLAAARDADRHLAENFRVVRGAVDRHEKVLVDLSAAEAASRDAHSAVVALEGDLRRQRVALNRAVGLPPEAKVTLRAGADFAAHMTPPPPTELSSDLESRRLDLVALKKGYESQDETLRAAILGQFPKINLGFNAASDTTNVHTIGVGVGIDIPLFDRNQGVIAAEKATRQRLFDEYAGRVFAARADIATAVADITTANDLIADIDAAIPALERLVRTYEQEMQQGNADVISYYAAVGALDQKRIAAVKLRQQLVQNWVALEIASGRTLAPPAAPTTRESKP